MPRGGTGRKPSVEVRIVGNEITGYRPGGIGEEGEPGVTVKATEATIQRWRRAILEYEVVQAEMEIQARRAELKRR
jgi:hypothetical protein